MIFATETASRWLLSSVPRSASGEIDLLNPLTVRFPDFPLARKYPIENVILSATSHWVYWTLFLPP